MTYVETQYSIERQPLTTFPDDLVDYLMRREVVPPFASLLEIGFGRGDFLQAWRRRLRMRVAGVDLEADTQELPDTFQIDVMQERLPFASGSFEVVFSKNLIEHLPDPTKFLNEIWRVLPSGGRVIIMTPDWRTYMKTFYDDYTHVRPYDVVSMADLLAARGFCEVNCTRIYQYPPIWRAPWLAVPATLWRWLIPVECSLWLSRVTGFGFFRWASQLAVLAVARKPAS